MIKKTADILLKTDFPELTLFRRGKVRDVYDLGDKLLVVSTDRISCFDVVLPTGIPYKGKVLTQLSLFWFDLIKDVVEHHLISANVDDYPASLSRHKEILRGRSMLVKKAESLPVECVVRGYLSGSGLKEYQQTRSVCGIALPSGLRESDKLPKVIFTPSTKESVGHDINVSEAHVEEKLGTDTTQKIRELSLALYKKASRFAEDKGVIIADTKFEFGRYKNKIILIDEALTPDSSRFWPKNEYAPGRSQPSFDKQFVRDYLEEIRWNKTPPAPPLPPEIVEKTTEKYLTIFRLLTGKDLAI